MYNYRAIKFLRENKTVFIIIAIGLILVELEIFALAAMKSGRKSYLKIMNSRGDVIHQTDGDNLSEFNKYYFERTFGPFENYDVKLEVKEKPFPFRGWFVASLGIPIGAILLFGFISKAYFSIFQFTNKDPILNEVSNSINQKSRFDIFIDRVNKMNIFIIGFITFIALIAYFIFPDVIRYVGRVGTDNIVRFRWFFISVIIISVVLIIWIIYLKYRLSKANIESRVDIEKHKLRLQFKSTAYLTNSNNANVVNDGSNKEALIESTHSR